MQGDGGGGQEMSWGANSLDIPLYRVEKCNFISERRAVDWQSEIFPIIRSGTNIMQKQFIMTWSKTEKTRKKFNSAFIFIATLLFR